MTDQWVPGPAPVPTPPIAGLPAANSWTPSPPCTSGDNPSIVDGVVITGVPAKIIAPYAWGITLNDGSAPPNFAIDHYSASGVLIESPIAIDGASGDVTLTHDPTQPFGAVTKQYVDNEIAAIGGIPEAPIDLNVYGRGNASWRVVPPEAPIDGQLYARSMLAWQAVPVQSDAPSDGNAYARQNGAWTAAVTGGPYLPLTGGAIIGNLSVSGVTTVLGSNSLVLNALTTGQQRSILAQQNGQSRWQLILADQTPETGSNTGSNFALNALSDGGSILGATLAINRATGQAAFGAPMTIQGPAGNLPTITLSKVASSPAAILSQTAAGLARWQMSLGNVNAELGGNLGSNFSLTSYDDSGNALATPLSIARSTGVATFSNLPSFPGGALNYVLATNGAGVLAWAPPGGGAPPSTIPPLMNGTAAVGTGTNYSREDHVHPSDTSRLPLTGGALSGGLNFNGAAFNRFIGGLTGASWRWAVNVGDSATESGANAGSNFTIQRFSDAGASIDFPLAINRATGVVSAPDGLSAPQAIGDNRIINGDMRIDQRNNGASGTAIGVYTVDRWFYNANAVYGAWQRLASAAMVANGFPYCFNFNSSSAHTIAAGDYSQFSQAIEADMVSDLAWGTANAQPVTLQFWVQSSKTGAFSGSIQNYAGSRSYPFSYSIPTANTWTKIVITIPGDTGGTWVMSGNAGAAAIGFDLGSGTTWRGAAGAWTASNFLGVTGAQSIINTNGAILNVTGVKLEVGNVATPFNRQSLAKSMADCQRYYQTGFAQFYGYNSAGTLWATQWPNQVMMRAAPTIVYTPGLASNTTGVALQANGAGQQLLYNGTVTALGGFSAQGNYTLSAEL